MTFNGVSPRPSYKSTIRLAIVNDFEVVVEGVRAILDTGQGFTFVDLDDRALETGSVDIVLYDNFAQPWRDSGHLTDLIERSKAKVVVFTWTLDDAWITHAYSVGAAGYLSKALSATDIASALQLIHRGHKVTGRPLVMTGSHDAGAWPGQGQGLTSRESEILALITQGLSNYQIAAALYLSINSVKTYIRTAYRKIGVRTRSQAVRYGMQNGFEPSRTSAVN